MEQGDGLIDVKSGSWVYSNASPPNVTILNTDIRISGGTVNLTGQIYMGQNVATTFEIIGGAASVGLARINNGPGGNSGTFKFVFDASGVSPINVSAWMFLDTIQLVVDGSAYTGGAGAFRLFDAVNFVGLIPPGHITVTGFENSGLTASVEQDQTNGKDWVRLILSD